MILSENALSLYLPPYSHDLNPIELLWSKLKILFANGKFVMLNFYEMLSKPLFSEFYFLIVKIGSLTRVTDIIFPNRYSFFAQ